MQNCFIVSALQHGRRENTLYTYDFQICVKVKLIISTSASGVCYRNDLFLLNFFITSGNNYKQLLFVVEKCGKRLSALVGGR